MAGPFWPETLFDSIGSVAVAERNLLEACWCARNRMPAAVRHELLREPIHASDLDCGQRSSGIGHSQNIQSLDNEDVTIRYKGDAVSLRLQVVCSLPVLFPFTKNVYASSLIMTMLADGGAFPREGLRV